MHVAVAENNKQYVVRQVHGFGAFGEQFRGQVQALAAQGLHVSFPY